MRFVPLPRSAQLYVAVVFGLSLLALVLSLLQPSTQTPFDVFVLVVVAAAIAHSVPVSTSTRPAYHVSLPFVVAGMILFAPLQLVVLIGAMHATGWVCRRRSGFAQLFTFVAFTVSALVAQAAYGVLWPAHGGPPTDLSQPACLVAGVVAAAVFALLNRSLVTFPIWLGDRVSPRVPPRVHQGFEAEGLLPDSVLLLMGVPMAYLVLLAPWAAAVVAAPLWLMYRALDLPNVPARSRQDGLTELFTGPYLAEASIRELSRARRFNRPLTLLLIDLDGLGELNAIYGHQAGDAVLRGTARSIRDAKRQYDLAARLSGGLFAVLLPETDLAWAQLVAERIRRGTADGRFEISSSIEHARLTLSIGGAVLQGGDGTSTQLFEAAQSALARAKGNGGDQIEFGVVEPTKLPVLRKPVDAADSTWTAPAAAATTALTGSAWPAGSVRSVGPVRSVEAVGAAEAGRTAPFGATGTAHTVVVDAAGTPLSHPVPHATDADQSALASPAGTPWGHPGPDARDAVRNILAGAAHDSLTGPGGAAAIVLIGSVGAPESPAGHTGALRSGTGHVGTAGPTGATVAGSVGTADVAPTTPVCAGGVFRTGPVDAAGAALTWPVGAVEGASGVDSAAVYVGPGDVGLPSVSARGLRTVRGRVLVGFAALLVGGGLLWSTATFDWRRLVVFGALAALAGLAFSFRPLTAALALAVETRGSPGLWTARYWRLWPMYLALGVTGFLVAYAYFRFGVLGALATVAAALGFHSLIGRYVDSTFESVRKLRTANQHLQYQAFHDPLTNVANRALFCERLGHAMVRAGEATSIAVLFVDLDNFKAVNDTLGHAIGDALLIATTDRMRTCVRREDTIARLGGDEFTVLLEDMRDPSDAARTAERIGQALRTPFELQGRTVVVSSSIGVALDTDRSHGPDDLMREADMAMYRAKAAGRARYEIFDTGMGTRATARLELETELRLALEHDNELAMHYQPVADLATGTLAAVEAVLRWQHPSRGLFETPAFRAVAEQAGLQVALGRWALAKACRDGTAWQAERPGLVVQLGVSQVEVEQASFVDLVTEALTTSGLPATCLMLAVSEHVLAQASDRLAVVFDALARLGVQLALDEVGGGVSSVAWLSRLPVATLKMAVSASHTPPVVRATVALGSALGMQVSVRGVDRADQAAALAAYGCRQAQGALYGDLRTAQAVFEQLATGDGYARAA